MKHCAWVLMMAGVALCGGQDPCSAQEPGPSIVFRAYAFSPDSKLLASVNSRSGEIELWDVPEMPR
jgi:hypothetical protein